MSTETKSGADARDASLASRASALVALCSAVYFTSYLTRKGYDASILAICEDTGLARSAAGIASTAAVVLYGSGQLVAGFLADRFDPRRIILLALLVTAGCNAAMPVVAGLVPAMAALWALNGFAQSMFWPPLVKIVAANLSPEAYKGAIFRISLACNAAIIAVFLLVSGCVRFAGWRLAFALVTATAFAMAAVWGATVRRLAPASMSGEGAAPPRSSRRHAAPGPSGESLFRIFAGAGLFYAMGAIACQGVMRDGIEVWASGIVKDLYGLGTSGSIFSVALLPAFAVASMMAARALRRVLGDEVKAAAVLFVVGLACAAALFASGGATLAAGLPLLAILSSCMHGTNLLLIGELPGRFAGRGCVGAVSGILNASTYVGAAASIYGFAALRERFAGWRPVFALWIAVLTVAILLCLAVLRRRRAA